MILNTIDTVFWLIDNVRYVIAVGLILSVSLFTLGTWYILSRIISFPSISTSICWIWKPLSLFFSLFGPSTSLRKSPRGRGTGNATARRGVVKKESRSGVKLGSPAASVKAPRTRSSTAATRTRKHESSSLVSEGLAIVRAAVTASLSIALVGSICICAFSLTASGCRVLRQLGLIEWLPWKEGLKCYRTKWDWVAEIFGELVLSVLRHHERSSSSSIGGLTGLSGLGGLGTARSGSS